MLRIITLDEEGTVFDKAPSENVYEYGDLYIETVSARYIFRRVYVAYDYCARILELLRTWNGEGSISIQLEAINDFTEFFAEGGLEIIHKHNPGGLCIDGDDKDVSCYFG